MKKIKKIIAVLLAVLIALSAGALTVFGAENSGDGNFILLKDLYGDEELNDGDWVFSWPMYIMWVNGITTREVEEQGLEDEIAAQVEEEKAKADIYYDPARQIFKVEFKDGSGSVIIDRENPSSGIYNYIYMRNLTSQYQAPAKQGFTFSRIWTIIVEIVQLIVQNLENLMKR